MRTDYPTTNNMKETTMARKPQPHQMKMDKIGVRSTHGIHGVFVPCRPSKDKPYDSFVLTLEKDRDMNHREYGQVCAYVKRALKAYRENGGQ